MARRQKESPLARRKVSTTVYLTEEQIEMLGKLSDVMDKPVVELVRMGIDIILEREKEHLKVPNHEPDVCIWCSHDFGILLLNKEMRPVRCWPACGKRAGVGWIPADRSEDVSRVMALAKKRMDDLSCRPPSNPPPKTRP
jgi:hypothetical protein